MISVKQAMDFYNREHAFFLHAGPDLMIPCGAVCGRSSLTPILSRSILDDRGNGNQCRKATINHFIPTQSMQPEEGFFQRTENLNV